MKYPIAIEPGNNSETYTYGILIPDLPNFFTASDSFEEAILNARAAINQHNLSQQQQSDMLMPTTIESHCNNPAYNGCYWTYIELNR